MLSLLLAGACLAPIITNLTDEPFGKNVHDRAALKKAGHTCIVRYKGCLKKFIKKDIQVYHAVCSKEWKE